MDQEKKKNKQVRRRPAKHDAFKPPKQSAQKEEFINPMDFWDMNVDDIKTDQPQRAQQQSKIKQQGLFVIGTDVGVGKTIAICALGTLLRKRHIRAAAFKPIECAGQDNRIFSDAFEIKLDAVYSFQKKTGPFFGFQQNKASFDIKKIGTAYKKAMDNSDMVFIEGTGGLCDPITEKCSTADMIKSLGLDVLVVASLDRGFLNHVIMIAQRAKALGLTVRGVLFTAKTKTVSKEYFLSAVQATQELAGIPVAGIVPFLENGSPEEIVEKCNKKISFKVLTGTVLGEIPGAALKKNSGQKPGRRVRHRRPSSPNTKKGDSQRPPKRHRRKRVPKKPQQ